MSRRSEQNPQVCTLPPFAFQTTLLCSLDVETLAMLTYIGLHVAKAVCLPGDNIERNQPWRCDCRATVVVGLSSVAEMRKRWEERSAPQISKLADRRSGFVS